MAEQPVFEVENVEPIATTILNRYRYASYSLPFTDTELTNVFTAEELKELEIFKQKISDASKSNHQKAKIIEKYSNICLKLLKLARVAV